MPGVRTVGWWLATAGLLLIQPLYFDRGFTEQFLYPKLVLTEILLLIAFVPAVAAMTREVGPASFSFWSTAPLLLFGCAAVLASVNSSAPAFSLRQAAYLLCGPAWLGIVCLVESGGERVVRRLAQLAAIAGSIMAGIAVLQWTGYDAVAAGGPPIDWGHMVSRMHLYSTLGNPNYVAGYLIAAVFLTTAQGLTAEMRSTRIVWFGGTLIILLAIAGTGSFGAWVGLAGGILVAALIWKRPNSYLTASSMKTAPSRRALQRRLGISSGTVLLGCVALLFGRSWATGLLRVPAVESRLYGRIYLWRVDWPLFKLHPWLGNGAGAVQLQFLDLQAQFLATHPTATHFWSNITQLHNDPLQLLLECGILGFAAFLWILVAYIRSLREALRSSPSRSFHGWLAASAGGVMAILVDSIFNFQFSIAPSWILLFTLMAFPILLTSQAPSSRKPAGREPTGPRSSRRIRQPLATTLALVCALAGIIFVAKLAAAERKYAAGVRYEDHRGYTLAEASYRDGLQLDPLNGRLHFGLARVLYLRRSLPEALHEAEQADAAYADSHLEVLKARIRDAMGLAIPALASYRHALWLDPNLTTVQADIARLEK